MREFRCDYCEQAWSTRRYLDTHACIGASSPTIADFHRFLQVVTDQYGCMIPMNTKAFKRVGYQGKYLAVRAYTYRTLGLNESYVHRIAWCLANNKSIPVEKTVSHECAPPHYENSMCCNPAHLVLRTHKENHQYMDPETRLKISNAGAKAVREKFARGELSGPSVEQKQQISKSLSRYYKTHERTDAQKEQFRNISRRGRRVSDATRQKMSESAKRRWARRNGVNYGTSIQT